MYTAAPVISSRNSSCEAAPPMTGKMKATQASSDSLHFRTKSPLHRVQWPRTLRTWEFSILKSRGTQKGWSLLALCRDLGRCRGFCVHAWSHIYFIFDFSSFTNLLIHLIHFSKSSGNLSWKTILQNSKFITPKTVAFCFVKEQDSAIQWSERTPSAIWFLEIWQACAGVDESTCVCFWVIFHTLRRQANKETPGLQWDSSHHKNLSDAPRFLVASLPLVTIQFIKHVSRKHTSGYIDTHSLNFYTLFLSPSLPPAFPLLLWHVPIQKSTE